MDSIKVPKITLNNGVTMPQLGLGVWQIEDNDELQVAIKQALDSGYRAFDTAAVYGNEAGVGEALAASGLPREELFVTTKLWNSDQGYDSALAAFDASLEKLQIEQLDLYLIHWPMPKVGKFKDTWRAFERLYEEGRVRAIGVSNFNESHLSDLMESANIVPAVNQVELHPQLIQLPLREFCGEHDIRVESWSPLMHGGAVLEDEVVTGIARVHYKTPAQVVLRWHIQHGLIVIPKSKTPERVAENIEIFDFELSDDDMRAIDGLNQDRRVGPDPDLLNE